MVSLDKEGDIMRFKGDIIITDPCYIIREKLGKPSMSDYPALRGKNSKRFSEYTDKELAAYEKLKNAELEWEKLNPDDWDFCENGENMGVLGFTTYLTRDTYYGDWSCKTVNKNTNSVIGHFCADAGMVGVFLLSEVLSYNPSFDDHKTKDWTTTLIKDFDGDIEIILGNFDYEDENGKIATVYEVRVIGTGNINFYTTQTGF